MLSILATGRLAANPEVRTGPSGRPYTRARLFCPSEGGDVPLSMIAFGAVGEELATVPAGVAISVSGRFKLARWTAKDGTSGPGYRSPSTRSCTQGRHAAGRDRRFTTRTTTRTSTP
jgi:hypothetical protein